MQWSMANINLVLILLFIVASVIAISLTHRTSRWKALLATSILFYYLLIGNKILVIFLLAGITYYFAYVVNTKKNTSWLPVTLLLIPLLIFKITGPIIQFDTYQIESLGYLNLANGAYIFQILGLSYFTFNSISYVIDIRRRYIAPEKNFLFLLLYLIYFPTVFSGPLHRAKYIFDHFRNIDVTNDSISRGLRLILWALFKNLVIGQRIYMLLIQLQDTDIGGIYYLVIGILFFFYLYCNFSSFIDFFQGVSEIFGIRLKTNFKNRIYHSSSRQQFWKGWHITLNEWFRDYFFFPISKFDKSRKFTDVLLIITFILIALWHGFSTTLLVWGLLNGLWIVIEKKVKFSNWKYFKFRNIAGVIYHLLISGILALVFISPNLSNLINKLFVQPSYFPLNFLKNYLISFLIVAGSFIIMDFHYSQAKNMRIDDYLGTKPKLIRWLIYIKLAIIILIFGMSTSVENFYNQF